MLLVPCRVSIPEDEQDTRLSEKLKAELPGIFCWAIAGLYRLLQVGRFTNPELCSDALKDYRAESNPARLFLTECCREELDGSIPCAVVYHDYKQWCSVNGYRPLGERTFGKEVARVYPRVQRDRRGAREHREYRYQGLAVPPVPPVS